MKKVGDEKLKPPEPKPDFRHKWGTPPQNQPKIQPTSIELKFSG